MNNENMRSGAHHASPFSHSHSHFHNHCHIYNTPDAHSLIIEPWSKSKIFRVQAILLTHSSTRAECDSRKPYIRFHLSRHQCMKRRHVTSEPNIEVPCLKWETWGMHSNSPRMAGLHLDRHARVAIRQESLTAIFQSI